MANNTETNTNKVPGLVQVKLDRNLDFNNVISTATITSKDLELKIAELFSGTFSDFEGCKIIDGGNGMMKCKLYFKPCPAKTEDGIYAVKVRGEDVTQKRKNFSLRDVVNTVNMLSTSKQFELEETAQEILAEFLIIPDAKIVDRYNPDLGKVVKVRLPKNWNVYTEEITDVVNNTRFQNPYLAVTVDLIPIVAKLYGKKDQDEVDALSTRGAIPKDRYQYSANIVKVLNPTMLQYILEIRRIDINEMNRLSQSIGYGMVQGSIVMTRR